MKKHFYTLILFFSFHTMVAEATKWYEGSVVLRSNEVITGKISVVQGHDAVLYKNGNDLLVLPAHKIRSVYYYDERANINRKFTSIQHFTASFKTYQLYEVVLLGEVKILRRINPSMTDLRNDALSYTYFISYNDNLIKLRKFRSKVYPQLLKASEKVLQFKHEQKLNPNSLSDAIRIIKFFNNECCPTTTFAKL